MRSQYAVMPNGLTQLVNEYLLKYVFFFFGAEILNNCELQSSQQLCLSVSLEMCVASVRMR